MTDKNNTDSQTDIKPVFFDRKGREITPITVRVGDKPMSFDDWCRDYGSCAGKVCDKAGAITDEEGGQ